MLSGELTRLEQADADGLADVLHIQLAGNTAYERLESFVKQAGNPYRFKVAQTPVRVSFRAGSGKLADRLTRHFLSLKRGG